MDTFVEWINNSLVQSAIISPIIGAVLGVLFSGFNSTAPSNAPATVQQTTIIFVQTIVVKQSGGKATSSGDAWACALAILGGVAAVTWGYSRYASEILYYWSISLFSCTAFILSAGFVSVVRAQFRSAEWGWYIFAPLAAVVGVYYLIQLANEGIISWAREAALQHRFIDFYFNVLENKHRIWLFWQLIGVLLGISATLIAVLRSLHYLALMNQRANGGMSALWYRFALYSRYVAGGGGVFLLVSFLGISYFTLAGYAYELLVK